MSIYKRSGKKLTPIKEKKVDTEKTFQNLVEENLNDVFGLTFISTEFPLNNLRIDTLAFDEEQKSFVIIEYKKDRSFSVIDQGYAYLALLLNNKADFVLEYNEKCGKNLRKDDVDWSQSKIIFIASSFTKYQQEAMGFQDLPIELWEVKKYENDLVLFNELRPSEKSESIKTVAKGKNADVVTKEIKQYSIEDHFRPDWEKTKELFELLSQRILELDSKIEMRPVKHYIGFNIGNKNVIAVIIRQSKLVITLIRVKPEDLRDPEKRVEYRKNSLKYYNVYLADFDLTTEDDIDYAMMLIKQAYKKFVE